MTKNITLALLREALFELCPEWWRKWPCPVHIVQLDSEFSTVRDTPLIQG